MPLFFNFLRLHDWLTQIKRAKESLQYSIKIFSKRQQTDLINIFRKYIFNFLGIFLNIHFYRNKKSEVLSSRGKTKIDFKDIWGKKYLVDKNLLTR